MCVNAPRNHAVHYPDLKRVGYGQYVLADASTRDIAHGPPAPREQDDELGLGDAVARLGDFLERAPLTSAIAGLEHALDERSSEDVGDVVSDAGIDQDLLVASVVTRAGLGRLTDLIHAVGIVLALPRLLEPGEVVVNRPSLAAGNDPSRPYDLETDRRVAEFKFSVWTGKDAMRKRQTFKDFVHLAADDSGRRRCLYVIGKRPVRFLRTTTAAAAWGLDRHPATRRLFAEQFGPLEQEIGAFVESRDDVELVDLTELAPDLFAGMLPDGVTPAPPSSAQRHEGVDRGMVGVDRHEESAVPDDLEAQFHADMVGIYERAKREIGYVPTRFLQLVSEQGGQAAARRLLRGSESDGFTTLWEKGRLDLSVERLTLEPQYESLFTEDERAIARRRLTDYGFDFDADP